MRRNPCNSALTSAWSSGSSRKSWHFPSAHFATEERLAGHTKRMEPGRELSASQDGALPLAGAAAPLAPATPSFAQVYDEHFEFVWRSARRLGVPELNLDDVVQDTFVTVYRRLADF